MSNQLMLWPDARPVERLRWSISRHKRLRDCDRKYFLYHFGSAGGGRPEASPQTRQIYMLKHLRNRFMWVGQVVHELVELCLNRWRSGHEVSLESLIQRGTRWMRQHYAESLQGAYKERPTQACGFIEHEYAEIISRDEWQAQRDRMERCLRNFFELDITREIRATPSWSWLALEATGSFEVDGATVVVKPDFAWRTATGEVILVDWKTGKPRDDERVQLAVYGIFAQRVWGLAADSLSARLVYLDSAQVDAFELGPADFQKAEADVRQSVARMRLLGSTEGDIPRPERFVRTDDLRLCAHCTFRRVCGRDTAA